MMFVLTLTLADSGTYLPNVVELTNIDIPITNINLLLHHSMSTIQCQSECASTPGCVAYTIECGDGPNCGPSTTHRYCGGESVLGANNIVPNSQSVTLVKLNGAYSPIVGVDFSGNNITSLYATMQDCISACDNNPACGMFTIAVSSYPINGDAVNVCNLKTNTNIDWVFNDGYQSYVMPKTTTSGIHSMFTCVPCPAGEFNFNTGYVGNFV